MPDQDPISRLNAALEGRYRIERELGQGGMATVYLARDVKHNRNVALKVLKPELAAVVGADRFLAEIETTANLQHPHILALFDSGAADSFLFYVMPYVDGESLRERLDREKQLPVDEAVRIVIDVSEALEHAHSRGVIHRDIKPENILLQAGKPVVSDFGIALAVGTAGGGRLTGTGMSLGTPHYMSPEQATGDVGLGPATDLYALGCVLYEMLVGEPPYTGSTPQAILGKIIQSEPVSAAKTRSSVPANVDAAIRRALEKLPADRFAGASAFAEALGDSTFRHGPGAAPGSAAVVEPSKAPSLAGWGVAAVFALVAGWALLSAPPPSGPREYDVGLPDEAPLAFGALSRLDVSPDGSFVVYVASTDSPMQLWYRSLSDGQARPIRGSEGASFLPMISPDGERVAFVHEDAGLRTVPVQGGDPTNLTDVLTGASGSWLPDGRIFVSDADGLRVRFIDAGGAGDLRTIRTAFCLLPRYLQEVDQLTCGGGGEKYGRLMGLSDASSSTLLTRAGDDPGEAALPLRGSDFRVLEGRYLIYVSIEGDLRATSIDLESMTVGASVPLVGDLRTESYSGQGEYALSDNGTLVYAQGVRESVGQLMLASDDGVPRPLAISPAPFLRFDVSPDNRRLVAAQEGPRGQELHVYDLATGRGGAPELEAAFVHYPRWSPTSDRILVAIQPRPDDPRSSLVTVSPNSASPPDTLAELAFAVGDYFADTLVVGDFGRAGTGPGAILDLTSEPVTVDTFMAAGVFAPSVSPDGRWLVYNSGETETFLEPFPERDRRFEVANEVAVGDALWLSNEELALFDASTTSWHRIPIDASSEPPHGEATFWFEDPLFSDTPGASNSVTAEGDIIYLRGPDKRTATYLRVVPNWVEQMKRAVDEANRTRG